MNKEQFGTWLVYIGTAGLIVAAIMSFTMYSGIDKGAVPAVSFLLIMIGLCFCFPTLLEESAGQMSTMRVVVFSIVMVFVVIYVKIGWNAGTFEEFTIDRTWVYILGLALAGKAVQRFGEEDDEKDTPKGQKRAPNN
jgi:hypothetical protein